jgi:small subunit ribosomal protein S8
MDKISEMLTKIRNAQAVGHEEVFIKTSKLKLALAEILEKEGFVTEIKNEKGSGFIKIILKYYQQSNTKKIPAIKGLKKISKSGQRIYTSKGMMTGDQSKKAGLGGEYICEVW